MTHPPLPSKGQLHGKSLMSRLRMAAGIILVVGVVYLYYRSLCDHGSFAPFTLIFTFPYSAPTAKPADSKPLRVVVSMTTIPSNIGSLNDTLTSLMKQTRTPDRIYINFPKVNRRTQEPYGDPPAWLTAFPGVAVNRLDEDWGPVTKLAGCLHVETDPDTLIITFDDDKTYSPHIIEKLVHHAQMDASVAWGICGWGFMPFFPPQRLLPAYVPYALRGRDGRGVQVLQGVCGAAYRRKFFPDLALLRAPAKECFTTDDIWISGYLNKQGVRRILTPGRWLSHFSLFGAASDEPSTTPWMFTHERKNSLSTVNHVYGKDYACFDAVARNLGAWEGY